MQHESVTGQFHKQNCTSLGIYFITYFIKIFLSILDVCLNWNVKRKMEYFSSSSSWSSLLLFHFLHWFACGLHWFRSRERFRFLCITMAYSFVVFAVFTFLRVVYSIWWKPRSFEKYMRQQGIGGSPYKLWFGDTKAIKQSFMEARSKPMALNHSIVPRVLPFYHQMAQKYGKSIIMSFLNLNLINF